MDMENGDSSSAILVEPEFSMEKLLPGRVYTVSVAAVSRNMVGAEVSVTHSTSKYMAEYFLKILLLICFGKFSQTTYFSDEVKKNNNFT